jgi:DNA-binding CsgD family transcriptional regulator
MNLQEHLDILGKRKKSKVGDIIAAYEVKKWPNGRLEEFVEMGVLASISKATQIKCPCCYRRCPIEPIQETSPDGTIHYEVLCEKEGSRDISPFYMEQWQITEKIKDHVSPGTKIRKRLASSKLSKIEQQVYSMIHVQGKNVSEAALEMNCSVQNIYKHERNAQKKLEAQNSSTRSVSAYNNLPQDNRGQVNVSEDTDD